MTRIPVIASKADVPAGHGHVWDQIASSRGRVVGPFTVLLHRPELARRISELGAYIRFESVPGRVDRELAIIALAREMDCQFEWAYHVLEARKVGVREEAITAVREARTEDSRRTRRSSFVTWACCSAAIASTQRDLRRPARPPGRRRPRGADGHRRLLRYARVYPERIRRDARGGRGGPECSVTW